MAIELIRNPETGIMEAYKNGEKLGEVITMGDMVNQSNTK